MQLQHLYRERLLEEYFEGLNSGDVSRAADYTCGHLVIAYAASSPVFGVSSLTDVVPEPLSLNSSRCGIRRITELVCARLGALDAPRSLVMRYESVWDEDIRRTPAVWPAVIRQVRYREATMVSCLESLVFGVTLQERRFATQAARCLKVRHHQLRQQAVYLDALTRTTDVLKLYFGS
jgi:hypothetical protein